MDTMDIFLLTLLIFIGALLYSSVGHGGASAYLAAMALFGLSPLVMKPVGLVLNILVSSIATVRFYKAKYFSWPVFLPVAITAVPCAYIGGAMTVPSHLYKTIAGIILLFSAVRLLMHKVTPNNPIKSMPIFPAIIAGMGIGFLSGLVGVGGGIFLSPLLLLMRWSNPKETSGISAAFILVNSISGLIGLGSIGFTLPYYLPILAVAAITGGMIGSKFGSRLKTQSMTIRRILAIVLIIAGFKLLLV